MYVWHLSRGGPDGNIGWVLVKISHMLLLLPLSPCLFHSVCVDPLMSVSQASYGHHRRLAFDLSLLWARYRGAHSGKRNICLKKKKRDNKTASWMFTRMYFIHMAQTSKEKLYSWLSASGSHYISSSWLSPLLHLPLEQDQPIRT